MDDLEKRDSGLPTGPMAEGGMLIGGGILALLFKGLIVWLGIGAIAAWGVYSLATKRQGAGATALGFAAITALLVFFFGHTLVWLAGLGAIGFGIYRIIEGLSKK